MPRYAERNPRPGNACRRSDPLPLPPRAKSVVVSEGEESETMRHSRMARIAVRGYRHSAAARSTGLGCVSRASLPTLSRSALRSRPSCGPLSSGLNQPGSPQSLET